ncbi:MAG: hypothetical protein HY670_00715 [Chloroflexi bacterium]|nr:hypothetical protein [Chloroflexota bacterium]
MLFPVRIHRIEDEVAIRFKAATAIEKLSLDSSPLEEQLALIEIAYEIAVAAALKALYVAKRNLRADTRGFWFAVHAMKQFTQRLNQMGYFLENENATFARDLHIAKSSLKKMKTFYKRFPNLESIDPSVPWNKYRSGRTIPRSAL